jgi:hypothetical protein
MDDALDRLGGARFFSTIDLASGYWQVGVDPASREKTAFVTPDGLFEFHRMPFGLCNAPATFQRLMDRVLGSLKWTHCLVYLDDILVFGRTLEEHNTRLAAVLERLQASGLTVNVAKCRFAAESVSFLGHEVSAEGLRPNPEKVRAVAKFRPPTTVSQLRSFLGLVSFYRRFIPGFSTRALPLTRLLKKAAKWRWEEEESGAFDDLRTALATAPVLAPFRDDLPVEVFTDASGVGLGAVLMQPHEEGLRPVAYVSRRLVGAEERYHSNEQEILAVVWALGKLRPYVYGRRVIVHTDNNVVRWLYSKKEISGRLSRWVLALQEYDPDIVHVSASTNQVADALSRAPLACSAFLLGEGASSVPELAFLQQGDVQIGPLVKAVQGLCPEASRKYPMDRFRLSRGVLFRQNDGSGRRFQLVVPMTMRPVVLRRMHQDQVAGHLGINKTLTRVQERYWWPGLGRDVSDFVASCFSCQKLKPGPVPPVGQLQPLTPPRRPFEFVSIDHMGPLVRTGRGNQHVLVAIDHLTKWVEIEAVSDTTASRTVEFLLNRVCLRHGFPRVVLSDRGTAFTARVFEEFCEEWGIQHRMSAPEHPQTNGLVERMNKTIGPVLASYVNKSHTNWDELVPFAAFAINTAVQETTGFAPFELVCGRTAVFPHEWSFPWPGETPFRYRRFNRNVGRLRRAARERARRVMERRRTRFDSRHKPARDLFPGDLMLVRRKPRTQGLSKKFLPRFIGPYQVRRRLGPVTYLVEDVPARRRKRVWRSFPAHVSQIRSFRVPHLALTRNRPTRETGETPEVPARNEACINALQGDAEGSESDVIRAPPTELPAEARVLDRPRRERKAPAHLKDFELGDSDE